jgi:hypothetical protein
VTSLRPLSVSSPFILWCCTQNHQCHPHHTTPSPLFILTTSNPFLKQFTRYPYSVTCTIIIFSALLHNIIFILIFFFIGGSPPHRARP